MRSTLFQHPSHEALLKRLLSQCGFYDTSATVCAASLKILLQDFKNSQHTEIKDIAEILLENLLDERIYIIKDEKIQMLCFEIPTTNSALINEIETSLKKINTILFPQIADAEQILENLQH